MHLKMICANYCTLCSVSRLIIELFKLSIFVDFFYLFDPLTPENCVKIDYYDGRSV